MKKLDELKTSRQTWHGVELYTSAEEATAHGFALMYEDERGSVYGIRNAEAVAAGNFGKWDKVAFVPIAEYMEEYAAQAVEDMPTVEEIAKQREENAKTLKELKAKAETARAEWDSLTDAEKWKYIKETPKNERVMRGWEEIEKEIKRYQEIGYILRNNYRAALASVAIPSLREIVNKYAGKQAGEKTRAKIAEEMRAACGCSFFFNYNDFGGGASSGTLYDSGNEKIEIYTQPGKRFINGNNTIERIEAGDRFGTNACVYVENPAERVDEIHEAARKADELRKEINEAIDKYNVLTVDGFDTLNRIYF